MQMDYSGLVTIRTVVVFHLKHILDVTQIVNSGDTYSPTLATEAFLYTQLDFVYTIFLVVYCLKN